jgi:NADPH-dependent 2,4-dienoyl-CoA reductase/sulfur reductase-like enzyme
VSEGPARVDTAGIVIVGGGQAGGRVAEALRGNGYAGPITLIGEEPHLPYERPSLSKELLLDGSADRIVWVQPRHFYERNAIALRLQVRAVRIDRKAKRIELNDGAALPYRSLVIATGARVRRFPVPKAVETRCFTVRTIEDSLALHGLMGPDVALVIIGAGFIGLEVAVAARAKGCRVTVIDGTRYPMQRCVPEDIGAHFLDIHRSHGVTVEMNNRIDRISAQDGRPVVETSRGERLVADVLVMGLGVVPNVELAAEAGLVVDDGIRVDAGCRTSDPDVFAVGDVASRFDSRTQRWVRPESWHGAQSQALTAARAIAGLDPPKPDVSWFWSDQYRTNLQVYGFPDPCDAVVCRGELGRGAALRLYMRNGRIGAAVGVNAGRDIRIAREMIATGVMPPLQLLSDASRGMSDIWKSLKA